MSQPGKRRSSKATFYPESQVGGFSDIDGTIAFYTRINALIKPTFTVLDFGCGRGAPQLDDPVEFRRTLRILQGKCEKLIGVDVDPVGEGNTHIDEFFLIQPGSPLPIADESIDLIVCDFVVEHLPDPSASFKEAYRVLKKGGTLCIRTTNVLNYVGIATRLIPNSLHTKILGKIQPDRKEDDVFPTVHRCNTVPTMKRILRNEGFDAVVFGYEAEPSYLSFSKIVYALGVLHQRLAPGLVRTGIFAFAVKPL